MESFAQNHWTVLNNQHWFAIFVTPSIFENSSEKPLLNLTALLL
ncbi:hypothetical protein THF5H11_20542 [Vibrio jasicida]|nr:hypothetical protein THF5H11_20542 [Vibrio jasicida]